MTKQEITQVIKALEATKDIIVAAGESASKELSRSKIKMAEVVGLLNTSILTAPGDYSLGAISLEDAKDIATSCTLDSAIGHASTAQIMTTLLGVDVPVNRQMFAQEVGQRCLVFKLRGRPEEGKILTADEIAKIGYVWQVLTRNS